MTVLYANKFSQSVATALTTGATTLVLDSYAGLPSIGGGDTCRLTIENGADSEIVLATATGGSGLTITRAQEGTTALAFNTSSTVENRATALDYEEATKYTGETRAIDFGAAASFEIPNATASTTNAAGEIALNTSGDVTNVTSATLQAYNGTSNYYFFGTTSYPTTAGETLQLSTAGTIVWAASGGASAIEDLSNMTESTEYNTGDGISFDDHSFILSGNPYLTNGGAELVTNSYQYRKYGWQNVSSVIYPQIVGSGTGNYFGFTSTGPRMVNGARSVQLLTTGFESAGDIFPSADSSFDLGTSSKAFAQIYTDSVTFDGGTNNFNYYETGAFTPVVSDAATGGNDATAATTTGEYTKIGDVVVCCISLVDINTSGLTGGSTVKITGMPFTSKNTTNLRSYGICYTNGISLGSSPYVARMFPNTNYLMFYEPVASGSNAAVVSDLTSGSADIELTIVYLSN